MTVPSGRRSPSTRQLSGQPGNQAQDAQAAAALAQAGYPDAAQVAAGPVSPGAAGRHPRPGGGGSRSPMSRA